MPLKFFVFDILAKNGEDLLQKPLSERREILEATIGKTPSLAITDHIVTDSPDRLRTYHAEQIKKGLEGIVVKKWDSPYEPGRKGFSWVKFKEEREKPENSRIRSTASSWGSVSGRESGPDSASGHFSWVLRHPMTGSSPSPGSEPA